MEKEIENILKKLAESLRADILLYSGEINLSNAEVLGTLTAQPTSENVLLVLCTLGGDAHAAFRIARRLQERYKQFYLYIPSYCKSAGTLIAIGSDEIIMGDFSEFGPLDVQLREKEELFQYSSGLNVSEALNILKVETLNFFRDTVINLTEGAGLPTRSASEIATKLATGFITPIVSQIDPVRLGEVHRAVNIALAYGERLNKGRGNIASRSQLVALVQKYPSHGFVIDYEESKTLFKNVRKPNENESILASYMKDSLCPLRSDIVVKKYYPLEKTNGTVDQQRNSGGTEESKRGKAKDDSGNNIKFPEVKSTLSQ